LVLLVGLHPGKVEFVKEGVDDEELRSEDYVSLQSPLLPPLRWRTESEKQNRRLLEPPIPELHTDR
jgi:hypothetical protein